jgi:serine protease inhibitor
LAMVWNGANGETKTAIQNALGFTNYTAADLNGYYKKMREALLSTDPSVKLAIANSIWYRKGSTVNNEFLETNKTWFKAQTEAIDFDLPTAVDIINKWCSDNTNGLIKDVLKEISRDDMMFLINALYFNGTWAGGFAFKEADTKQATFKKSDGSSVTVNMMNNKTKMMYFTDETLSAINLPYGNGAYSMMLMLPQDNVSMQAMVTKLKSPLYWRNLMNNRVSKDVTIQVPKFKIKYDANFNEVLKQMGMAIAFDPYQADFSKIFPLDQTYITKVNQFTYIDVNEKGTEAAAVTIIGVGVTSAPQPTLFTANHPFVFAICEKSTGCVLFMGLVGNPS